MKKLFRFFILAAMAVALVVPIAKPQTVHATETDEDDIVYPVGEKMNFAGQLIDADPDHFRSDYDVTQLNIKSGDESVATVENAKFWIMNDTFYQYGYDITGKKEGTVSIYLYYQDKLVSEVPLTTITFTKRNTVTMYRLYNPNSGEHFYTSSTKEKATLVKAGWRDEGTGWNAPDTGDPVYRLYNKNGGEHHYTLSVKERDNLKKAGWNDEGIGWFSDPLEGVKVYRVYNPNKFANNHHYTTSTKERDYLVSIGWRDEKIAWYGVK